MNNFIVFLIVSSGYTTKCHRLGGLNNKHSFLTVLGVGSPRSKCQVISFLVKPSSWLTANLLSVLSHGRDRANSAVSSSYMNLTWGAPPPTSSPKLSYLSKDSLPNTITLEVRGQQCMSVGKRVANIPSITVLHPADRSLPT